MKQSVLGLIVTFALAFAAGCCCGTRAVEPAPAPEPPPSAEGAVPARPSVDKDATGD